MRAEAERCRRSAKQFDGRPEQPFLLKLANTFEEIALIQDRPQHQG
jgi:hypothetical protein